MDSRPKDQSLKYLGPPLNSRGVVLKRRLKPGAAASLTELSEYRFFSPAIPYLWGGFYEPYWCNWMVDLGHDVDLFFYKFEQPIFDGLISLTGADDWNYGLMACRTEDFGKLVDFFCELTVTMRQSQAVVRYGLQELAVLDPLAMDRRKVFVGDQTVTVINAFGLYGSHGVAYFEQPAPLARPVVTFHEGDRDMREFAAAYFKDRNPIHATEALELPKPVTEIPQPILFADREPQDQQRLLEAIRKAQQLQE